MKKARPPASPQKVWPQGLRACRYRHGFDIDAGAGLVEFDFAIDEGKQRPIPPGADVLAGANLCSALRAQDAAGGNKLAAISFHAQPFADAIASVADAALTFLVCHKL